MTSTCDDTPDLALVIATGDMRLYANVLLTIGVIETDASTSGATVSRRGLRRLRPGLAPGGPA